MIPCANANFAHRTAVETDCSRAAPNVSNPVPNVSSPVQDKFCPAQCAPGVFLFVFCPAPDGFASNPFRSPPGRHGKSPEPPGNPPEPCAKKYFAFGTTVERYCTGAAQYLSKAAPNLSDLARYLPNVGRYLSAPVQCLSSAGRHLSKSVRSLTKVVQNGLTAARHLSMVEQCVFCFVSSVYPVVIFDFFKEETDALVKSFLC